MDWDRLPAGRWGLRQLGVVSLLVAYAAGRHLVMIAPGYPRYQPPLVYGLALVAFVCGSAGCALLVHGRHLFDRVEVSERWRRPPPAVPRMEPVAALGDPASAESAWSAVAISTDRPGPVPSVPPGRYAA